MKVQKKMISMVFLSIVLIAFILLFPEDKNTLSVIMLVLGIYFALNYRRCMHLYFVLVLLVYTNFCSLVSSISTGGFHVNFELGIIAAGILILLSTIKRDIKQLYPTLLWFAVLLVSVMVAKLKYGQPIYMSITSVANKWFPLIIIPALAVYLKDSNDPYIIVQYITRITLLVCAVLCLQYYVLGDKYILLDLALKKRYSGETGFLIHLVSPIFLLCLAIILLKNEKKAIDWFTVFAIMFTLITVAKTRVFMFAAFGIIVYCIFFYNRKISLKTKYGMIFIVSILVIPLIPTIMNMVGNTFFSEILMKGDDYIRFREIMWFDQVNNSPKWLGIGVENRAYQGSPFLTGVENFKYYVSDLGVIGMFFQYGIQGIVMFAVYLIQMRRLGRSEIGNYEQGLFNCLILMILMTSVSVSPMQFIVPIVIVFSLIIGLSDRSSVCEEDY